MKITDIQSWSEFGFEKMTPEARMRFYPLLCAALIADAGGSLEVSERALREVLNYLLTNTATEIELSVHTDGSLRVRLGGGPYVG